MNLDRIGNITSELSSSLVRAIVLPGGLLGWLKRPLSERGRTRRWLRSMVDASDAQVTVRMHMPEIAPLVLLGGCPVPDEAVVAILHLAGGRAANLAVLAVGASVESQCVANSLRLFSRYGMKNVRLVEISSSEQANDPDVARLIAEADGAFVCGEDAASAMQILSGTRAVESLQRLAAAGKVLAGLDAGAAIFGERLMGQLDGEHRMIEGLGIAPGLILDTDLTSQARFGRLLKAMNTGSGGARLGVGLDAGAALVVRGGEARVLGETTVTFFDPCDMTGHHESVNGRVCELKVHVLMEGYGINLRTRRPFAPTQVAQVSGDD